MGTVVSLRSVAVPTARNAQEARTILPTALRALRRLRAYVVALGGTPDDADGDE